MTCAVYFNLDGTLTENTLDFEQIYSDALTDAGLEGLDDTYESYTDTFFNFFQRGWAFPRRQAILQVLQDNGIDDTGHSDAFAAAWEDHEAEQTAYRNGAADIVQRVAEQHATGIITNGTGRLQRMKVENSGLLNTIDSLIISSEIGIVKPNAAFFEEAKHATDADTYIVVSHDLRRDILPAKRSDYKTIWIADADTENNPQIKQVVDTQVTSLEDVPAAINQLCQ